MLQQNTPDDYVIATGITHSVRQVLETAFSHVGMNYKEYVEIDAGLLRPAEVAHLRGDSSKASSRLGWKPTVGFEELIGLMVDSDIELVSGQSPRASWATAL